MEQKAYGTGPWEKGKWRLSYPRTYSVEQGRRPASLGLGALSPSGVLVPS